MLKRDPLVDAAAIGLPAAGLAAAAGRGFGTGLPMAPGDGLASAAGDGLGLGLAEGAGREMMAVGVAGSGELPGTGELVTSLVPGAASGWALHAATITLTATSSR